ncbi:MAG: ABC transporter permease [Bacillota bacterium]
MPGPRRPDAPRLKLPAIHWENLANVLTPMAAIIASLAVGSLVIAMLKVNPVVAYGHLFRGAAGNLGQVTMTITNSIPLIFAGLAVTLAFRAGTFNIGGEGQLYMGALLAVWAGTALRLPLGVHVLAALACGAAGGAAWALVPGYLKARRGFNEVIITILMNYIAVWFVSYMVHSLLREPGWSPQTRQVLATARLPQLISGTSLHAGILLAIAAAVAVHFLLTRTGLGFAIRMVGSNREAARWAGIDVAKVTIITMCLSGALAGLAGASEILGVRFRLLDGFSPGYGFDAIAVALLGRTTAVGTIFGALFFGALRTGANVMQSATGLPVVAVYLIQGLVVLFMIAGTSMDVVRKLLAKRKEVAAGAGPVRGGAVG